jgi:hypothetical protein
MGRRARIGAGWVLAAFLILGARPGASQTTPDEQRVAEAVARPFLSRRPERPGRLYVRIRNQATPFDSAVARLLAPPLPAWTDARSDEASVYTRGVTIAGDTASVLWVAVSRTEDSMRDIVTTRLIFVRAAEGWELDREEYVDGATVGSVRG